MKEPMSEFTAILIWMGLLSICLLTMGWFGLIPALFFLLLVMNFEG